MKQIAFSILLSILLFSCGSNAPYTSGRARLEQQAHIQLPGAVGVLNQVYHGGMDYEIDYRIRVAEQDEPALIKRIRSSGYLDASVYRGPGGWRAGGPYAFCSQEEGQWCRAYKGYEFSSMNHGTSVYVNYDTVTNVLTYHELGD